MTASIRNPHVLLLCTLAQGDEAALQFPLPDYILGFHAQQSCEKLLKALISSHNRTYPLTHGLEELSDLLLVCGEIVPPLPYSLKDLEPFAVKMRYDLLIQLSEAECDAIRQSIAQLRRHVLARILALESAP